MSETRQRVRRGSMVVTVFRRIGLVVLGVVLYAVCINMFAGFPQFHTAILTWVAIVAMAVFAGVVWIVDERRWNREHPLDEEDTDADPDGRIHPHGRDAD